MNDTLNQRKQIPDNAGFVNLPYFDVLLKLINEGDYEVEKSFGRHVHWGYWQQPQLASLTTEDFACAAENLSQQVCKASCIKDGNKVLDVGCGFGGTLAHLNEHFTGLDLVGLNLDDRQLLRAGSTVMPVADNHIHFVQGNACSLPFPDQSFDVVLAVECIFHFPDRRLFFEEAYRVLKPGGFLALSDFIPRSVLLPFTRLKMALPGRFSTGFYGKCNVQCTIEEYWELADQTHFMVRAEHDITENTLPTYTYIKRLARTRPVASFMAMLETAFIEWVSRRNLMKYYIFAFQKSHSWGSE